MDVAGEARCIYVDSSGVWQVTQCTSTKEFYCVDMSVAPNPTPNPTAAPTDDNWQNRITGVLDGLNGSIFAGIMLAAGPILCLFGKKLFKFIIFIVGFALIGWFTLQGLTEHQEFFNLEDDMVLYIALGVGIAGGGMLVFLTKLSIIVCGAAFGVIGAQALWQIIESAVTDSLGDDAKWVHIGMLVGTGLVGGFAAYKLVNQVLKIATAFIGAFFTVSGAAFFVAKWLDEENAWLSPDTFWTDFSPENAEDQLTRECEAFCGVCYAMWLILFVVGAWYQYRGKNLLKKKKKEEENPEVTNLKEQLEMQEMMMRQQQQPIMPAPNPMFSNVKINLKKRGKKKDSNLGVIVPQNNYGRLSAPIGYAGQSPSMIPQMGHNPGAMSVGSGMSVSSAPAYQYVPQGQVVQRIATQPQMVMVNQHGQVIGHMPRSQTPLSINLRR